MTKPPSTDLEKYPHLDKKTQDKADLADEVRKSAIRAGTWIALAHVKLALKKLEELRTYPKVTRMPCLLLVGAPFSGKTSILEHFRDQHPPDMDPAAETMHCEVLMIDAPPKPDLADFYSRILDALMAPYKPTAPAYAKYSQVKLLFKQLGVRVLIIDEIHHLIAGSQNRQREFRNALKSLGNETKVCIVAAGIDEAYTAFNADAQLSSRFMPMELPKWSPGEKLGTLLATLEKRTPLRNASGLHQPQLMLAIHSRAESNLGDICDLVKEAAVAAIDTGQECISEKLIAGLDWVPPSKRRMYRPKL
ncbi:MAG: transposase [Ideonella sp. MAG2]|nr:MAG: transposase [Ideonella sp. MAG2]